MFDYSDFLVEAMEYVDKKIEGLNHKGVDRNRFHSKIKIQITTNVKRIAVLEHSDAYREIDNIFNTQLLEEVSRYL